MKFFAGPTGPGLTPLPDDTRAMRVVLPDGNHIELRLRGDQVILHTSASMRLSPTASNSVVVELEDE